MQHDVSDGRLARLLRETRLPLSKLARREGVSPPTTWRWWRKGCRGVCLETFVVGGTRFTTEEAHARWVEGVTVAANGERPTVSTNRSREAAVAKAERDLAAEGI